MNLTQEAITTLLSEWSSKQTALAKRVIKEDLFESIRYIGGLDVSFNLEGTIGVGALVVLEADTMKVAYENTITEPPSIPYISGFLGFREIPYATKLINQLRQEKPNLFPQIFLVDGNGIYHPRGCGFATQLGIELEVPTIGVSKSFFQLDGMTKEKQVENQHKNAFKILKGESGFIWGAVLFPKTCSPNTKHPIYVSIGHKVSLDSALRIVQQFSIFKVPEPIRLADKKSREEITRWTLKN